MFISISFYGQRLTREDYIKLYSQWAVDEMRISGVPASITLAQGMLESDNGNSKLAQKANNHFGIKCHGWEGKKFYQDDDEKHECFRKYKSVFDSFKDHSAFLKCNSRYNFLFDLNPADYKAWAKGLSKAGYATSKKYPELLIKIIEDNKLYRFDSIALSSSELIADNNKVNNNEKQHKIDKQNKQNRRKSIKLGDDNNYSINLNGRKIFYNNRIKYIKVKKGDTFLKIAEEFDMMAGQLYRYNELGKDAQLKEGQILYLQPKRSKAEFGKDKHIVQMGETLYSISQKYGIKMRSLCFKNGVELGADIKPGTELWLRKRKPPTKS
ncbi:MAG: glucosaminidase domain-containing protein [Marinilabiliales bacterium]